MTINRDDDGVLRWCRDDAPDILHRLDGPAVIRPDGTEEWWINGFQLPAAQLKTMGDRMRHWFAQHPPAVNWAAVGPVLTWGQTEPSLELPLNKELAALASRRDIPPWLQARLLKLSRKSGELLKGLERKLPDTIVTTKKPCTEKID